MRKMFVKRRYFIPSIDYQLESRFLPKRDVRIKSSARPSGVDPFRDEHFPPEYPLGLDDDGSECECHCHLGEEDEA